MSSSSSSSSSILDLLEDIEESERTLAAASQRHAHGGYAASSSRQLQAGSEEDAFLSESLSASAEMMSASLGIDSGDEETETNASTHAQQSFKEKHAVNKAVAKAREGATDQERRIVALTNLARKNASRDTKTKVAAMVPPDAHNVATRLKRLVRAGDERKRTTHPLAHVPIPDDVSPAWTAKVVARAHALKLARTADAWFEARRPEAMSSEQAASLWAGLAAKRVRSYTARCVVDEDLRRVPPTAAETVAEALREGEASLLAREHALGTRKGTAGVDDATPPASGVNVALAAHQVLGESRLLRAACRLSAAFHDAGCTTEVRSVLTRRLTHLPATTHALTSFHQAGECADEGGEARGAAVARMALEDCRQLRQRAGDTLTTFAF